jgi:hypothetical protein
MDSPCTLNRPMHRRSCCSLMVSLCVLACTAVAPLSLWRLAGEVRTEDHNRDGRPDVWRIYDRQGRLAKVALDTNFDGRSDVQEYYERGALVRRESDRNFNDRVDLVQEFDATTREALRSVVDVDFDGNADLLVVFQGGQPVFSKWAHNTAPVAPGADAARPAEAAPRTADSQLAPLEDSFRRDLAVRAVRAAVGSGDFVGLSTSDGLPARGDSVVSFVASSSDIAASRVPQTSSAAALPYSPRGPPSHLTS